MCPMHCFPPNICLDPNIALTAFFSSVLCNSAFSCFYFESACDFIQPGVAYCQQYLWRDVLLDDFVTM